MKFIRLINTNNSADGILDNEFNQDIEIAENSQIAFRSIAVDLDPQSFNVNDTNNTIQFQSNINKVDTIGTAKLINKTYDTSNATELLDDLQKKSNSCLTANRNIGVQFQCLIKNGKTRIESKFCPNSSKILTENVTGDYGSTLNDAFVSSTGGMSSGASAQADDRNLIFSHQEFGKGCAVFRTRIRNLTDNLGASNINGFEIGLSDVNPTTWATGAAFTLPDNQKTYNVSIGKPTDNYFFNDKGGSNQDSGIAPENHILNSRTINDIVELKKEGEKLIISIYRNGQAESDILSTTFLSTTYDGAGQLGVEQPLYPYIIFHAKNTNCRLDDYSRCFFDPFVSNIPSVAVTQEDIDAGNEHYAMSVGVRPPDARPLDTTRKFTFNSVETARHLGFENNELLSETRLNYLVHSNNSYTSALTYDDIVVELMNLQVDSYDGLEKGRRNLIATIPTISNSNGVIVNEANNLVFIDLHNAQPRFFRNIKARLLYGDLTSIKTQGLTSMTLLIKSKDE